METTVIDKLLEEDKQYWLDRLSGRLLSAGFSTDFNRPATASSAKESVPIRISPQTSERIQQVTGDNDTLAFTLFATVTGILLQKHTGMEDIVVGATIHNTHAETASLNELIALRLKISATHTPRELLKTVRQTLGEAYQHQKYPFRNLLADLGIERQPDRAPLFDVALFLDSINDPQPLNALNHDLTFGLYRGREGYTGTAEYNPQLFQRDTVQALAAQFSNVLEQTVAKPETPLQQVSLLSPEDVQALDRFNSTAKSYPVDKTVVDLFERQAAENPSSTAIECLGMGLTFAELNARANQLAHYLRDLGVASGAYVGIYLEHSLETIVAILAVLKAGGAYVPCDPSHPAFRLKYVLGDAGITIVLTQAKFLDRFEDTSVDLDKTVCLDTQSESFDQYPIENLDNSPSPRDIAYVIYTSGSTGQPKGVQIEHASLVNYLSWCRDVYVKDEERVFSLYSSLAFDLTVTSVFTPLVTGNRLIIYREQQGIPAIVQVVQDNRADVVKLTPSHLALVTDSDRIESRVKAFIVGGEALQVGLAKRIERVFGSHVEILNEYGPTEATVGCMLHRFNGKNDTRLFVPIGIPAANTQIYLLDDELRHVATSVLGEIYIAGDGLARGYLGRDDLTRERFVPNPFVPGRRMYRTGDLGRRLPCGKLEFIGRVDDELKYHGHRISLNEITSHLNQHPRVNNSTLSVVKDEEDHDVLMACYVAADAIDSNELRAFMAERLILETVPSLFVRLERIPLTVNGKVDVDALPSLAAARKLMRARHVSPRSETEARIAEIWEGLFNIDRVGAFDHFFDLGGHSLLATKAMARISDAFGVELSVRYLFESPTVAGLGQLIDTAQWASQTSSEGSTTEDDADVDMEFGEL